MITVDEEEESGSEVERGDDGERGVERKEGVWGGDAKGEGLAIMQRCEGREGNAGKRK